MIDPTIDINGRAFWAHNCGNPRALQQIDGELRFDLRSGDNWPRTPGNDRTEVCTVEKFGACTVEFDMMVEAGKNTADWLALGQYHQKDSPTVAIELAGEKLRIVARDQAKYIRVDELPLVRDRWLWFKLQITPGIGLWAWLDGKPLKSYDGPMGWPGLKGNWKSGIYSEASRDIRRVRMRHLTITPLA